MGEKNSDYTVIEADRIVDARGERGPHRITLNKGKILELEPLTTTVRADPNERRTLVPGFIDIHVHGGSGRYVMEDEPDVLSVIAHHLAQRGVTSFLPTTITAPWDNIESTIGRVFSLRSSPPLGAHILGVHLEGPCINVMMKGAQPPQFVAPPDTDEMKRRIEPYGDTVRVVTLAPEVDGAMSLIRYLNSKNVIVSLGHTDATYDQVSAAIDHGARHCTHCYNQMRPLHHREPGTVGAALNRSELRAEVIWDNIHVHPAAAQILMRAKGRHGVILISDGTPGSGMPVGYEFNFGDLPIRVQQQGGKLPNGSMAKSTRIGCFLPDGTLAGSAITVADAFVNAIECGASWQDATAASSYNAACALGLEGSKGLIEVGYDADLVQLNENGQVESVWVDGCQIQNEQRPVI